MGDSWPIFGISEAFCSSGNVLLWTMTAYITSPLTESRINSHSAYTISSMKKPSSSKNPIAPRKSGEKRRRRRREQRRKSRSCPTCLISPMVSQTRITCMGHLSATIEIYMRNQIVVLLTATVLLARWLCLLVPGREDWRRTCHNLHSGWAVLSVRRRRD